MTSTAKKWTIGSMITTLVGVCAILAFMEVGFPFVFASDYKNHVAQSEKKFEEINGKMDKLLLLQYLARKVELEERLDSGEGDYEDRLELEEIKQAIRELRNA